MLSRRANISGLQNRALHFAFVHFEYVTMAIHMLNLRGQYSKAERGTSIVEWVSSRLDDCKHFIDKGEYGSIHFTVMIYLFDVNHITAPWLYPKSKQFFFEK